MPQNFSHFGAYFKTAFLNRWNLLGFLGGAGFAILSGRPDIFLPLILAGEVAYVGLLGTHPKFQQYVESQQAKALRAQSASAHQQTLQYILRGLPRELLSRYESLRSQCLDLQQIARELKQPGLRAGQMPLEEFQRSGFDRLLWLYLRLLYTQYSLARFLQKTDAKQLQKRVEELDARIARLSTQAQDDRWTRVHRALTDDLETTRARMANLLKARDNYQLVQLDIDRLENKIRSLSEMAVNRHEPEFITGQVDQVASSMVETERTMNELQFATGLELADQEVPELLRPQPVSAASKAL